MRCPLCSGKLGTDWIKVGTVYVHRYCAYVHVRKIGGSFKDIEPKQQDSNEDPFE